MLGEIISSLFNAQCSSYNNNFSRKTCSAPENCYLCMTLGMMGLVIHTLPFGVPFVSGIYSVDWLESIFHIVSNVALLVVRSLPAFLSDVAVVAVVGVSG